MNRFPVPRGVGLYALIGMGVVYGCLLETSPVSAACGDYVMIGGHNVGHQHSLPVETASRSGSRGLTPRSPCPGGVCSRQDQEPLVPASPRVHLDNDQWLAIVDHVGSTTESSGLLVRDMPLIRPEHHGLLILRPPR